MSDELHLQTSFPLDDDGYLARACQDERCSPGYFLILHRKDGPEIGYCPYCRESGPASEFLTPEQQENIHSVLLRYAEDRFNDAIREGLGVGPLGRKQYGGGGMFSIEMSFKPRQNTPVYVPVEEELVRKITCPKCGHGHAVYGLATWCPECGSDCFLEHVSAEFRTVRGMLKDSERRRETLGARVAAKDVENALEDTVSIFEAAIKQLVRRHLTESGSTTEAAEDAVQKCKTAFQSIKRGVNEFRDCTGKELLKGLTDSETEQFSRAFEKRHPITHNLAVVDRKYMERARTGELHGRDVRLSAEEVQATIDLALRVIAGGHGQLFGDRAAQEAGD